LFLGSDPSKPFFLILKPKLKLKSIIIESIHVPFFIVHIIYFSQILFTKLVLHQKKKKEKKEKERLLIAKVVQTLQK